MTKATDLRRSLLDLESDLEGALEDLAWEIRQAL